MTSSGYSPAVTRPLGSAGLSVSQLGYGGSALGRLQAGQNEATANVSLEAAWMRGMRYVDSAPSYGRGLSEHRIGAFLRQVPRDECVLSTKVGRLLTPWPRGKAAPTDTLRFEAHFDYSYDATLRSVEDSLQRLGLDRIDLLTLHDLSPRWHGAELEQRFAEAMDGAQRALVDLRAQGVVRAIGVGVNDVDVCMRCLAAGDFDYFMLAGRLTLLDHQGALPLLQACAARDVALLAAAPFNSGILATGADASARFFYAAPPPEILERTRHISRLCAEHGVALGAAAVQFALGHPVVASVVPSFQNEAQLAEVCEWMAAPIPEALWQALSAAGLLHWYPGAPDAG